MIVLKFAVLSVLILLFLVALFAAFNGVRQMATGYDHRGQEWSSDHTTAFCLVMVVLILSGAGIGTIAASLLA